MFHVGWRGLDDLIEVRRSILSKNPTEMRLGCAQMRAWMFKGRVPLWIDVTRQVAEAIVEIDKNGVEQITRLRDHMEIRSLLKNQSMDTKLVAIMAKTELTREEAIEFGNFALGKLDAVYWDPQITKLQNDTNYSQRTHIIPQLIDNLCDGTVSRDHVISILSNTPESFEAAVFYLAEKLINGNAVAGQKLNELGKQVDIQKISEFIRCSDFSSAAAEWLRSHGCETEKLAKWPVTAIGMLPFSTPPLTVESEIVELQNPVDPPLDERLNGLQAASRMRGGRGLAPATPARQAPKKMGLELRLGNSGPRNRGMGNPGGGRRQPPMPRVTEPGDYHVPSYHHPAPKPEPREFDENATAIAPPVAAGMAMQTQGQFKINPGLIVQRK